MNRCCATLVLADDFGDNQCTFSCQLPVSHEGCHEETGKLEEAYPFTVTWEGDMRVEDLIRRVEEECSS